MSEVDVRILAIGHAVSSVILAINFVALLSMLFLFLRKRKELEELNCTLDAQFVLNNELIEASEARQRRREQFEKAMQLAITDALYPEALPFPELATRRKSYAALQLSISCGLISINEARIIVEARIQKELEEHQAFLSEETPPA